MPRPARQRNIVSLSFAISTYGFLILGSGVGFVASRLVSKQSGTTQFFVGLGPRPEPLPS